MTNLDVTPLAGSLIVLAKATLLLVIAFAGATLLQRAAAGARHLLWVASIGALLLLPALSAWSPLRLAVLPASLSSATPVSVDPVLRLDAATRTASPAFSASEASSAAPAPDESRVSSSTVAIATPALRDRFASLSPLQVALIVWGAVALALGAWLALSFFLVQRIVRRASPLDGRDWTTPLYEIADRLGVERTPRIVRSGEVAMPFAAGLVQPTIVLPAGAESWDEERRRAVLMHELAHIRRRDLLGHTLGRVACALYWFHPLVWSAARRLRIESERACDDLALTCGLRPSSYAEHLLEIVSGIRQPRTPAMAIPMADRKEFEGRMLAILDPEVRRSPGRLQSLSVVGALAALVVVVGAAAPAPSSADTSALATRHATPTLSGDSGVVQRVLQRVDRSTDRQLDERTSRRVETRTQRSAEPMPPEMPSPDVSNAVSGAARVDVPLPLPLELKGSVVKGIVGAFLDTLTTQGEDKRAALLMQVLRADTSAELRRVAAWGLERYAHGSEVQDALAAALRADRSASVRESAAWALNDGTPRPGVVAALSEALRSDADDKVRETAAWSLGSLGAESARDALVAALADRNAAVRQRALWAIGSVGEGKAPAPVLEALTDSSPGVRHTAAWVLFNLEDPAAIPALERALARETDPSLRNAYVRALGAMGGDAAPALARLLDSNDPGVRATVVSALAGRRGGPWPMPQPRPRPFP